MQNREQLLSGINAILAERKLRPLPKLGLASEGEIEITGINEIFDHSARFFTDVKFDVIFPNGTTGAFTIRFNANGAVSDGSVIALMLNGEFAIVKQWRPALGRWTSELPRGFMPQFHAARTSGHLETLCAKDFLFGIVARELGADLMSTAKINRWLPLGHIAENSGTHAVAPSYDLVQLSVDPAKLAARMKSREDGGLVALLLWSRRTLIEQMGRALADSHSITGAALALAALDRHWNR